MVLQRVEVVDGDCAIHQRRRGATAVDQQAGVGDLNLIGAQQRRVAAVEQHAIEAVLARLVAVGGGQQLAFAGVEPFLASVVAHRHRCGDDRAGADHLGDAAEVRIGPVEPAALAAGRAADQAEVDLIGVAIAIPILRQRVADEAGDRRTAEVERCKTGYERFVDQVVAVELCILAAHRVGAGQRRRGGRAGAEQQLPAVVGAPHQRRQRGGEAELAIAQFGHQFGRLLRVGDVEHQIGRAVAAVGGIAITIVVDVDRHPAKAHADHQNGAPAVGVVTVVGKRLDVEALGGAIDIEDVLIVGRGQPAQVRQQVLRHIGPEFGAERVAGLTVVGGRRELLVGLVPEAAIEGVHHAVVGADIDHLPALGIFGLEGGIAAVAKAQVMAGVGRAHHHRRAVDDVAQQPGFGAIAIVIDGAAAVAGDLLATDEVDDVGGLALRIGRAGVGVQLAKAAGQGGAGEVAQGAIGGGRVAGVDRPAVAGDVGIVALWHEWGMVCRPCQFIAGIPQRLQIGQRPHRGSDDLDVAAIGRDAAVAANLGAGRQVDRIEEDLHHRVDIAAIERGIARGRGIATEILPQPALSIDEEPMQRAGPGDAVLPRLDARMVERLIDRPLAGDIVRHHRRRGAGGHRAGHRGEDAVQRRLQTAGAAQLKVVVGHAIGSCGTGQVVDTVPLAWVVWRVAAVEVIEAAILGRQPQWFLQGGAATGDRQILKA